MPNPYHLYDTVLNDSKRICREVCIREDPAEICPNCLAEKRHREMMSVLLDINQTLQQLLRNKLEDTSMMSIGEKLDGIRYVLKNK